MPEKLSKTRKKRNPFFPNTNVKSSGEVWGEIRRLCLVASGLIFTLSLASYSPADPSWSNWSSNIEINNWMGRFGSLIADILFQLVGVLAIPLVVAPILVAFNVHQKLQFETRKTYWYSSLLLFVVTSSLLLHSLVPSKIFAWWSLHKTAGILGEASYYAFNYAFGTFGSLIVASAVFLASGMFLFQFEIFSKSRQLICKLGEGIVSIVARSAVEIPRIFHATRAKAFLHRAKKEKKKEDIPPSPVKQPEVKKEEPTSIQFVESVKDADFAKSLSTPKQGTQNAQLNLTMPVVKRDFELPSPNLLKGKNSRKKKPVDREWYVEKGNLLVEKLKDFGVDGEIVNVAPGPVITVYEFKPASGIKIREISNLSDDLTLALSVLSVRIVAPIPGKPVVGIEIPTPERETVFFRNMIQETPFYDGGLRIPIALGRLASGEPILTDLATMPHLLVAGATGTGKSVFVNTLIGSLLFRFAPQQLKMILVDPKMVELSNYEGIPHLLLPPVVDAKKAAMALRWLVEEMERRYRILHQFGVRHIDSYNARLNEMHKEELYTEHDFLPYIVTVIDEYADLMAVVSKEVEHSVTRLAQKARASGIHIVLATQRPSTDVVTGTIKANFPSRISFRVASAVDSKTILDRTGAERLLGNGDMLFHSAGFGTLKRLQGSFIDDGDLERTIQHLKSQGPPEYNEEILIEPELGEEDGKGEKNGPLYDAAVQLVAEKGEASISLIQRHLRIGYNRAANLMDEMEKQGVVGTPSGNSKRRPVLVQS